MREPSATRITIDPEICEGKPIIRGKRITVHTILGFLAAGEDREEILRQYPSLEPEDIDACVTFAMSFDESQNEIPRFFVAARLFELGRWSSGKAARFAGVSRATFLHRLERIGASAINLRDDEISAEIQAARELAQRDAIADQYRKAYANGTALGDEFKDWEDQSWRSEE